MAVTTAPTGRPQARTADRSQDRAERFVRARATEALGDRARLYPNVRWIDRTRAGGPARNGETDLLIVEPDRGILAIEVKGGPVRRDGFGRWYAATRHLETPPFAQIETGCHALERKIAEHPRWPGAKPRIVHAVAFPNTDRASIGHGGTGDLGPDAPIELVLDRADFRDATATASALGRVFDFWAGDGARDRPLTEHMLEVIDAVLEPEVTLRPLLRGDIEAGEAELLVPTDHQLTLLRTLRSERRASIEGGAGSGKTLLAAEKARQLASQGANTLLVCFNQPLSKALAERPDLAALVDEGRLTVSTFHQLCRRLGSEAGVLPPVPSKPPKTWWDEVLPGALDKAIDVLGGRYHAVVVDEGQDFRRSWLESLDLLLIEPGEDVFYLFHDPAQALYTTDETASLGLREFPIEDNCRNARPIHDFAYRFYTGSLSPVPLRDDGREVELIEAEPGAPTVDAVREALHRLVHVEGVDRSQVAVLVGVALSHSAIWQQRRFKGGLELWNGSYNAAGESLGLAADRAPAQPPGTIAIETIHRFKGLERDVVVLAELRPDDERLGKLLYVGATRAKHHLVVVVPPELSQGELRMATERARERH
jgi:superfamily I DNA/RNA helicase